MACTPIGLTGDGDENRNERGDDSGAFMIAFFDSSAFIYYFEGDSDLKQIILNSNRIDLVTKSYVAYPHTIRDEIAFSSIQDLIVQIKKDVETAKKIFKQKR